jgi:cobalt-zinc-cadmium efflux system protein
MIELHHTHEGHNHLIQKENITRAFIIGIVFNTIFVIVEALMGIYYNSLALISDAGHNLSDVASLILALIAIKISEKEANDKFTYGYRKTTIIVALLNAMILFGALCLIVYESILRLHSPKSIEASGMVTVAIIGIFINGITAILFKKEKERDINIKSAYLHLVADAFISMGVVIAGIIIIFTDWYWMDSIISIIISIIILFGTWQILTESLLLVLDGVPKNIDINKVKNEIITVQGVQDIHHLHVWALSTTTTALTVHVVVNLDDLNIIETIKAEIKHRLEHINIHHTTIEIETMTNQCKTDVCE